MEQNEDYRHSHTAKNKGVEYDRDFEELRYRKFIWEWEKKILVKIIRKFFPAQKEVCYLDFACGTGRIISFLQQYNFDATGVDVSESMLNEAKQKTAASPGKASQTKLILADLTKENLFPKENFDLITSFRFFLNAQQQLREDAFGILSGLLKKDGCFIFNVHMNRYSLLALRIRMYDFLSGSKRPNFNSMSIGEVKKMTTEAGLEITEMHHIGLLPIGSENTGVPLWLIRSAEFFVSRVPFLRHFSTYIIFVCRPVKHSYTERT